MENPIDIVDKIRAAIKTWMSQDKANTLTQLHAISGVSYAQVRRLSQGEVRNPTVDTIRKVLTGIWDEDRADSFIVESLQNPVFTSVLYKEHGSKTLSVYIRNERQALFVAKIAAREKISIENAKRTLGASNFDYLLPTYVEAGFVRIDGDTIYVTSRFTEHFDATSLRQLGLLVIAHNNPEREFDEVEVRLFGLNEKGRREANEALKECKRKLATILVKPENSGDIIYGISMFSATIDE